MLVPSKKIFYALEAVLFVAYNAKAGAIASRDIAERQNLPARYLEPILQKLVRGGILKSVRGPQGGYVLGRERRRVTLADICALLEGEDPMPDATMKLGDDVLRPMLAEAQKAWAEKLASIDMAALCELAAEKNIPAIADQTHDFTI